MYVLILAVRNASYWEEEPEEAPAARSIGAIAGLAVAIVMIVLVIMDIPAIYKDIKMLLSNLGLRRDQKQLLPSKNN